MKQFIGFLFEIYWCEASYWRDASYGSWLVWCSNVHFWTRKRLIHARLHIWSEFPISSYDIEVLRQSRRVRQNDQSRSRPVGHNGSFTNVIATRSSCPWPVANDALEVKPFNYPLTLRITKVVLFIRTRSSW